jgi:hypothetical protein
LGVSVLIVSSELTAWTRKCQILVGFIAQSKILQFVLNCSECSLYRYSLNIINIYPIYHHRKILLCMRKSSLVIN